MSWLYRSSRGSIYREIAILWCKWVKISSSKNTTDEGNATNEEETTRKAEIGKKELGNIKYMKKIDDTQISYVRWNLDTTIAL